MKIFQKIILSKVSFKINIFLRKCKKILIFYLVTYSFSCSSFIVPNPLIDTKNEIITSQIHTKREVKVDIKQKYSYEIDPVVLINVFPKRLKTTYDVYEKKFKKQSTSINWFWFSQFLGWIGLAAYIELEEEQGITSEGWILIVLFTIASLFASFEAGDTKTSHYKTIYKGESVKYKDLETAVGRSVKLEFYNLKGTKESIMLGRINSSNQLTIRLNNLLSKHKDKFKNIDELLHYFTFGQLIIDWKSLEK